MALFRLLIILVFFYSCLPQGGNITLGPQSQGSLSPGADITSITVTPTQLIINGSNFEGVTHVNIKDPSNGSVKPFEVVNATFSQLISEALDASVIPVDKALELILSNAYGQSSYPITFSLQSNAVATANIQNSAVTTQKLQGSPDPTNANGMALVWSSINNGFIFSPSGGGGGTSGVDAIFYGEGIVGDGITATGTVPINVNVGEAGSSTSTVIPYFNSQNKIVMDSTGLSPNFSGLRFIDGANYFDIFNENALKIENDSGDELFVLDYDGKLEVGGSQVCTQASGCSASGGTGITSVTATLPLVASATSGGVINISAKIGTAPGELVNLITGEGGIGALPPVSGRLLINVINTILPGDAISLTPPLLGVTTIGVNFGSGNAQRWQRNLDNLGTLNSNDNYVIIGNGTSFEVQGGDTLLTSIGAQKADSDLTSLAGLNPALGNIIVGGGATWNTSTIPNCAAGNVTLSSGTSFSCSGNLSPISAGTLTTFNQMGLQIKAPTAGTSTGELHFLGTNNSNYVGLKAATGVSSNTIWTLPLADGSLGYALITNGSGTLSWANVGGVNDVSIAGASTDNAIARFDGTNSKQIQNSGIIISDTNDISGVTAFTSTGNMTVDTNTFVVNATGDQVGIRNSTPTYTLDISGASNSGIHLKQGAQSTATAGAFKNGLVLEKSNALNAYALGYNTTDLFSIDNFDGTTYKNLFTLNNSGNGVFIGTLKVGAYTLPATDGSNTQALITNGAGTLTWSNVGGANDVSNASTSTTGNLASFNGATGKVIQDSGIASSNVVTMTSPALGVNRILTSQGLNKIAIDSGITIDNLTNNVTGMGTLNTRTIANWVDGPASASSTNLAAFNGTTGKLIQDSGLLTANIPTMVPNGVAGNLIQTAAANKALSDSGIAVANVVTKSSNFSAAYRVVLALNATSRNATETGYTIPTIICGTGLVLKSDGTNMICQADLNSGDVLGPGSSTDNAIAKFDLATGKIIQNSGVIISDTNAITGVASILSAGNVDAGQTTIGANTGVGGTFGCFSNNNFPNSATSYSHCQDDTGLTLLNAPTGQTVQTRINNSTVASVANTGLSVTGTLNVSGGSTLNQIVTMSGTGGTDNILTLTYGNCGSPCGQSDATNGATPAALHIIEGNTTSSASGGISFGDSNGQPSHAYIGTVVTDYANNRATLRIITRGADGWVQRATWGSPALFSEGMGVATLKSNDKTEFDKSFIFMAPADLVENVRLVLPNKRPTNDESLVSEGDKLVWRKVIPTEKYEADISDLKVVIELLKKRIEVLENR